LRGIVTASAENSNLGYVYIQQDGELAWSGIWVNGGSLITNLAVGDRVAVTGVVEEYFGLTRLSNISNVQVIQTGQVPPSPTILNPNLLTTYEFSTNEKYESMLVELQNPVGNLFVVDTNADASQLRNNGEWRVGNDVNDPSSGCRILTGRQASSSFSSLNVSYVNSPIWATTDGTMNVPVIVVQPGQQLTSVRGILTYSFSNMKLLPRNNSDIVDPSTSTKPQLGSNVSIMPNPVSDKMFIINRTGKPVAYKIVNSVGQVLESGDLQGVENQIKINLPTGIYQILTKNQHTSEIQRCRVNIK
jgi:predicted extracellular nuclease